MSEWTDFPGAPSGPMSRGATPPRRPDNAPGAPSGPMAQGATWRKDPALVALFKRVVGSDEVPQVPREAHADDVPDLPDLRAEEAWEQPELPTLGEAPAAKELAGTQEEMGTPDLPTVGEPETPDLPKLKEVQKTPDLPTLGGLPAARELSGTLEEMETPDLPTLTEQELPDLPTLAEQETPDLPTLEEKGKEVLPTGAAEREMRRERDREREMAAQGEQEKEAAAAAEERGGDAWTGGEIVGQIVANVLTGVENLLRLSQYQGMSGAGNAMPVFRQLPWAGRGSRSREDEEDYAAASPGVDVTTLTGVRGAGGWGFGSRHLGNTMSDRLEPGRRRPLGEEGL